MSTSPKYCDTLTFFSLEHFERNLLISQQKLEDYQVVGIVAEIAIFL
jgi:hypothetical protein